MTMLVVAPRAAAAVLRAAGARRAASRAMATYGAKGDTYIVPPDAIKNFHDKGYCVLRNFVTEEEIKVSACGARANYNSGAGRCAHSRDVRGFERAGWAYRTASMWHMQ
jgi:hypothetical protein